MSERLLYANSAILQLYHGETKLICNEMMMMSAFFQTNTLSFCLKCQLTETTVRGYTCRSTRTPYPDSGPTSLCSFSLILRALHYKQQIPVDNLWFDPIGNSNPQSTALEASTLTITLPMRVFGEHFWSVSQRIHTVYINDNI